MVAARARLTTLRFHGRDTGRAMSRENVDLVREGYEAINSGDVEKGLALFDPDTEIRPGVDAPNTDLKDVYYGAEGFLAFLGSLSEAFEEVSWEPEEFIDAGDDVLVLIRMTATGRGSGIEIDRPIAHICTMREGRLARHVTYWERARALEVVGLSE